MPNTLKIIQVNKGNSSLYNRIDQINDLITTHKPHIVIINELNSVNGDFTSRNQFPEYRMETDTLDITDKCSRTGILLHRDIHYRRQRDLEGVGLSTIWLQLTHPGRKPILLQALYRQFQRLGHPGTITPSSQHSRWTRIIDNWEKANSKGHEVISMGDTNLNSLRWDIQANNMNSYDRIKSPMIRDLQTRILDQGTQLLNSSPTRNNDHSDAMESCIDHIFTNRAAKITSFETGIPAFSDHTVQKLTRSTKGMKTSPKYLRFRSYKNFNLLQYKQNIRDHHLYISTLYENDTNIITENVKQIITDSLEEMAPMRMIQMSTKNKTRLSEDIKNKMIERDLAQHISKQTSTPQDIRHYKNLRNQVNQMISREKYCRKSKQFQTDDMTLNEKWKKIKLETGQSKFTVPQLFIEGASHHTGHIQIAESLNRQYIQKVRVLTKKMENHRGDPLDNYRKHVGIIQSTFTYKQVNMSQLRIILRKMRGTGSTGEDDLSMHNIKQAQSELEPLLLHLINQVFKTMTFPEALKTAKVVPIQKPGKETSSSDAWHPINVISTISKVIERVMLSQMLEYMNSNNMISHQHHGSVRAKSTQTMVTEIHDRLVKIMTEDDDAALILLDQSKAYDVVNHSILLSKLRILGFTRQAIQIMSTFLSDRKQMVQIEGRRSSKLLIGPQSVIQGSALSCLLFLTYILDMPSIFHNENHKPAESLDCKNTDLKTFVDDAYATVTKQPNKLLAQTVVETVDEIEDYMTKNKLVLNPDKSVAMLLTKDDVLRDNFVIRLGNKDIRHSKEVTILGNKMTDQLSWDRHVTNIVIPSLQNRLRSLRIISRYLGDKFRATYTSAIFRSKMMFGIETWGGTTPPLIKRVQNLQDQASRLAVPRISQEKSSRQRQTILNWMSVHQEIDRATHTQTYKVLNTGQPEEMATLMKINNKGHRLQKQRKLDTKPKYLNKTKLIRSTYHSMSYIYNTLPSSITTQPTLIKFKKHLKNYMKSKT